MPSKPTAQLLAAVVAVAAVAGAFTLGSSIATLATAPTKQVAAVQASLPRVTLPDNALTAKAAVLYDLKTGQVLYQKSAYQALPLASLTKLMATEVVLSKRTLDTQVRITAADLEPEGDSGLRVGQVMSLESLVRLALVASSNDAMQAAASTLGSDPVGAMNMAAEELGLTKTHFYNATGLDSTTESSGAYGSAYDVARLGAVFYKDHPDLFELTTHPEVTVDAGGKELTASATALPLQSTPGFVAAKTGYTDLAGGNLVAIFDLEPGVTVVAVALGSTIDGRFTDIKTIIEAARKSL